MPRKSVKRVEEAEHIINLDADAFAPNRWHVVRHIRGGSFKWDPTKMKLYLSKFQRDSKSIPGSQLFKELASRPIFNANLLDYLLAHPYLIPEEWKTDERGRTRYIFFWGTIYRNVGGDLCVRCLYWTGEKWWWSDHWVKFEWTAQYPAALRAA